MSSPNVAPDSVEITRLEAALEAALSTVAHLREENQKLAEAFRAAPSNPGREELRRAAAALSAAHNEADAARTALALWKATGATYGLVSQDGKITGTIAVRIAPGAGREARGQAIDDALGEQLTEAVTALGAVLAAAPESYTRERPGRDAEGRTVLEVAGRLEGDRLVPAVSRAARSLRR